MKATGNSEKIQKHEKRSAYNGGKKKVLYIMDQDHLIPKSANLQKKLRK